MTMPFESLLGRVGDLDSHEMIQMVPGTRFSQCFGKAGLRFLELNESLFQRLRQIFPAEEFADAPDDVEITERTVWEKKGIAAPSYADLDRRPRVMDTMGIRRQLVFPTFGTFAMASALGGGINGMPPATPEQIENGREGVKAYNAWAAQLTSKYPDRLRIVGLLDTAEPGLTPELLVKKVSDLIAAGMRAILITSGSPPAGLSPADPRLDPFYATFAQANVPIIFHPPSGAGFRKTDAWGIVPGVYWDLSWPAALHVAEENFLCVMTLGGVFERHPTLRVGFVETGGDWIGPLAERMDDGVLETASKPRSPVQHDLLSMKPSQYLARNVRVSVLLDEPVERWLRRYPTLQDVYCYSSDYPHPEGREWSLKEFYKRIAPLGDDVVEKFFVTNSQLILPAA